MKLVLKIFNYVIMAVSLAAAILLFAMPAFSFNSNIALDVEAFSKFVPETQYSKYINITDSLGTDEIQLGISFKLNAAEVAQVMDGNRDKINKKIVSKNVDGIVSTLHEPVDLITDFSIRTIIKTTIKEEISKQLTANAKTGSTAQEIMDEVGMDDEYFTNFSYALYDATNEDNSTVDSVTTVLYEQIDDALTMAEQAGAVSNPGYTNEKKEEVKNNLVQILNQLKLADESGNLKKLSDISYYYLSIYLQDYLEDKIEDPASLNIKSDETIPQHADRLLNVFVLTQMPDAFYKTIGGVSVGLFIGLFIFTATWLFLLGFTVYRVFFRKKNTFFGPWFWVVGSLQLVLGLGLTIFGKFIFPKIKFSAIGIPLKHVILAPRTYALVPSILYLVCALIAVPYLILKIFTPKEAKEPKVEEQQQ